LEGETKSPVGFARAVTRNLFKDEVLDPVVAIVVSGSATGALFAMVDALKDVLPRTDFP